MHHKDTTLIRDNIERYIEWRIEDLIVLSKSEHSKLHAKLNGFGKQEITTERRKKLSETRRRLFAEGKLDFSGEKNGMYGREFHWWTNGVDTVFSEVCPEGWYKGRKNVDPKNYTYSEQAKQNLIENGKKRKGQIPWNKKTV